MSEVYFQCYYVSLSSTDSCGCNDFIWSQYLAMIIEYMYKSCLCVILCIMLLPGEKFVLYYRIHIEFACSEAFLSLPSSCTLILGLFFLSMMDTEYAPYYFSIMFGNCFHIIIQALQLPTLILYFCYVTFSYDDWIKLYCIKYKHVSVVCIFF